MLQGVVGGVVRAEIGIEVAQDSDADGVAHGLIVLEATQRAAGDGATGLEAWCSQPHAGISVKDRLSMLRKK